MHIRRTRTQDRNKIEHLLRDPSNYVNLHIKWKTHTQTHKHTHTTYHIVSTNGPSLKENLSRKSVEKCKPKLTHVHTIKAATHGED